LNARDEPPIGWSVDGWSARLRQMADTCESYHADRAAELRRMADDCDGTCSTQDLHAAGLQRPEPKRPVPKPHKATRRQRTDEAQRGSEGLLFS